MSSETPNEGGHKKPPIPTPAKKIPALNIEKRGDRLYQVINAPQMVCNLQSACCS